MFIASVHVSELCKGLAEIIPEEGTVIGYCYMTMLRRNARCEHGTEVVGC
jgi:hypothetical protein